MRKGGLSCALVLLLVAVAAIVARVPAAASSAPTVPAPGQVTCTAKIRLTFSPPLTDGGGGTAPTAVGGTLTDCTDTDSGVINPGGKLSGTLGSASFAEPPLACPGQASEELPVDLSAKWGGVLHGSPSGNHLDRSTLTATGGQTTSNGSGDIGLLLPGSSGAAASTDSFAEAAPDGWDASLYSTDSQSAFDALCQSRKGVKTLRMAGTIRVGATYGFNGPRELASDGTHVWVANYFDSGDSVTEFDAATGAWIRTLSGSPYNFSNPSVLTYGDGSLWVISGNAVVEIDAATGAWIQTLSGGSYGFDGPYAMTVQGDDLWIVNNANASVTEVSASTGAWIQTLSGGSYGFDDPRAAVSDGTHIWVANTSGDSVTELDGATGAWIQTLTGSPYGFSDPNSMTFDGANVWVASYGNAVTEFDGTTGALIRTLTAHSYRFDDPSGVAFDGENVWVINSGFTPPYTNSLTEVNAASGDLVQSQLTACNGFSATPMGVDFDGSHVWISLQPGAQYSTDCVAEFDPSSGDLIQTLQG